MKFVYLVLFISVCSAEISLNNVPEIPDLDAIDAIKERCDKKGGPGTYDNFKKAKDEVQTCIQGYINVETIKSEVEEAKKTGSMDEVFGKYCGKRPQIKACITKFIDAGKPCLEENEKDGLNITMNILNQLGDFVCYRDGDRIAMFVAEGGVECIKSRTEGIKNCINSTLKVNPSTFSLNSLQSLSPNSKKRCEDFATIQTCVVEELEKCSDSTPANVVDALFKFIKKMACNKKQKRNIFKREIHQVFKDSLMHNKKTFLEKLKKSCDQYGSADNTWTEVERSAKEFKSCVMLTAVNSENEIDEHVSKCFESSKMVKSVQNCLPEEQKYYPELLAEYFKAFSVFEKKNHDKLTSKPENAVYFYCLQTLKNNPNSRMHSTKCFEEYYESEIGTKEHTCKKTTSFLNCLAEQIKSTCVKDIKINAVLDDFVKTMSKPCEV